MKAYKGFNSDMTCRGFQFEEGKTYEIDKAELCKCGFHACEDPIDVLGYYEPVDSDGKLRKYHEVELENVSDERGSGDSKVCAKKITIGAELNFMGLAKAHIEYVKAKCAPAKTQTAKKDKSIATNQGNMGVATNQGYMGVATNQGNMGVATNQGNMGVATNQGYRGVATNQGDMGVATNQGYMGVATNQGENGLAVAWGLNSKAKGTIGTHLVLSEWWEWDGEKYPLLCATMVVVDGKKIKEDTFYTLKGGDVKEVE